MKKDENTKSNPAAVSMKVPAYERFSFALIDGGYSMLNYLMTSFLTLYLTDTIGLTGTFVSLLLIVARIFDAVNDPVIGSLADRTKTRFGRYKPWCLVGSVAAAIMVVLMFSNQPDWSYTMRAVYAILIYLLVTVATTSMYIPQIALNTVISSDKRERDRVTKWRTVASNLGTCVVPMFATSLILSCSHSDTATAAGYSRAVMMIAVVAMVCGVIGSIVTKERLEAPKKQKNGIPLKDQLRAMFRNPAILLLMVCFIAHGLIAYGRGGVMLYYFTYYVGDVNIYSFVGITGLIGSFVGPLVFAALMMKFVPHKGKCSAITLFLIAICYTGMAVTDAHGIVWWILCASASIFQGAFAPIIFSAVPEACDYGELISGFRVDGFLSSAISFGLKFGSAIGPAIYLWAYSAAGYVPNQTQNATVLTLMNASVTWIPGLLVLVMGLLMLFCYRMTPEKHAAIMQELMRRRENQE